MEIKFNVFQKMVEKNDGSGKFKCNFTKALDDTSYNIKYIANCENLHLIPKDTKPFVLVVDSKNVSERVREVVSTKTGEMVTRRDIFVRKIDRIEEYIETEFDASAFGY